MRWLFFSLFLLPVFSLTTSEAQDKKFHVCFFELDNQTTSENLENHTDFKKSLSDKVKVHQFRPRTNTLDDFKAMIDQTNKAEKRCDSLVISGHHTENWSGKFGSKSLKLKDIENLSCDPKYKNWFENIQALWLDGCNTVTDNAIQTQNPLTPDSESARVSESDTAKNEDIKEYQIKNLSQFYSFSLDKNTPFSSRYLRSFPNTQIYGFNGPAPTGSKGEDQVGNISFIANHLTAMGEAFEVENSKHTEPVQSDIELGLEILTADPCKAVDIWNELGENRRDGIKLEAIKNKKYEEAKKLGCDLILAKQVLDNPNSTPAQKTLAEKIKKGNYPKKLKELANDILDTKQSKQSKEKAATKLAQQLVLQTLDTIKKEESSDDQLSLSHLLFHNIYETWTTAKKYNIKNNDTFFTSVQKKLQSKNFKDSIKTRIKDNQTSSIIKANYIKFYMDVNNKKDDDGIIDKAITDLFNKSTCSFTRKKKTPCHSVTTLQSPIKGTATLRARRALALSVADQLRQYDLLSPEQKKILSDSLFPNDGQTGKDAFSQSINIRFQVDIEGELNKEDTHPVFETLKNHGFSDTNQQFAITALIRHDINHFQDNPDTMMQRINSYGKYMQDENKGFLIENFNIELETYLNNKTQQEARKFITEYLDKKGTTHYLRTFLRRYGNQTLDMGIPEP